LLWVAVPFPDGDRGYSSAREQAEELLAARKNTRTWGPVTWHDLGGAGVPKSSLDGLRESVIDEKAYDELKKKPELLRKQYFVKAGERLCGVGLLKRLGAEPGFDGDGRAFRSRKPVFHSTSHVASAPILTRLARSGTAGEAALRAYLKQLESLGVDVELFRISIGVEAEAVVKNPLTPAEEATRAPRAFRSPDGKHLDGYLLFEGRLPELLTDYCFTEEDSPNPTKVAVARKALAGFRHAIGLRENHTTYYAYLLADGDSMGKAIDVLAKLPEGIAQHRRLGQALEAFSAECRRLVERAGGSLVYAGGDDVLESPNRFARRSGHGRPPPGGA